jgi:hypothetical protein
MFLWLLRAWRLGHPDTTLRRNASFARQLASASGGEVTARMVSRFESRSMSGTHITADWITHYESVLGLPRGQLLDPYGVYLHASGRNIRVSRGPTDHVPMAWDWLVEAASGTALSAQQWRDVVDILATGTALGSRTRQRLYDELAQSLARSSAFEESVLADAASRLANEPGQFQALRQVALDRENARSNHAASAFRDFPTADMTRTVVEIARSGDLLTTGRAMEAWGVAVRNNPGLAEEAKQTDLLSYLYEYATSDDPGYGTTMRARRALKAAYPEEAGPLAKSLLTKGTPHRSGVGVISGTADLRAIARQAAARATVALGVQDPWLPGLLSLAIAPGSSDLRSLARCLIRASPYAPPLSQDLANALLRREQSLPLQRDLIRFLGVLGQNRVEMHLCRIITSTYRTEIFMAAAAALCDLPLIDDAWILPLYRRVARHPELCVALLNLAGSHGLRNVLEDAGRHRDPRVERERTYWLRQPTPGRTWTLQGRPATP